VIAADAIIDELTVATRANDEQWRSFALIEPGRELDIHLATIVPCPDRAPRWIVAGDGIGKAQVGQRNVGSNRPGLLGKLVLPLQDQKPVLRIGQADCRHRCAVCALQRQMIGAPVSRDDHIGDKPSGEWLHQHMHTGVIARTADTSGLLDTPMEG
jgi:hypothetical protein